MSRPLNVTIFNEFLHEKNERIKKIYPNGIHGTIAEKLSELGDYNIRIATLEMPEHGLSKEVLNNTDYLSGGRTAHTQRSRTRLHSA